MSTKEKRRNPLTENEGFLWLKMEFNLLSILNLSIGQAVLSRGILIVAWMKPSA